jgi:hypothetical protein
MTGSQHLFRLDHNIQQGEGQQHPDLLQEYMNVLDGIDKRFGNRSNVQLRNSA